VKELQEGLIHRTVGLTETEEEMDLDYCKEPVHEELTYALSNSLGFGGHNASILIKKYME
jgi:3-oxoacyl-[acyl-carrier-protein] synthase II